MAKQVLEWPKVVGPLIFSWPMAMLFLSVLFRDLVPKLANRLIASSDVKAEFGPLKVQLGTIAKESQDILERLNKFLDISAHHKIINNEMLTNQLGHRFTLTQIQQIDEQSNEIKELLASKNSFSAHNKNSPPGLVGKSSYFM